MHIRELGLDVDVFTYEEAFAPTDNVGAKFLARVDFACRVISVQFAFPSSHSGFYPILSFFCVLSGSFCCVFFTRMPSCSATLTRVEDVMSK